MREWTTKGAASLDRSGLKVVLEHKPESYLPLKETIAAFPCQKQCPLCFVISLGN